MNNPVLAHQHKRREHLAREPPDKRRRKPSEPVGLDELIQVNTQQLSDDAEMVAESKVLVHFQDVILLLGVLKTI